MPTPSSDGSVLPSAAPKAPAPGDLAVGLLGFLPAAATFAIIPMLPWILIDNHGFSVEATSGWIALWLLFATLGQIPAQMLIARFRRRQRHLLVAATAATLIFPLSLLQADPLLLSIAFALSALAGAVHSLMAVRLCDRMGERRGRGFSFLHTGANCGAIAGPATALVLNGARFEIMVAGLVALRAVSALVTMALLWRSAQLDADVQGELPARANTLAALRSGTFGVSPGILLILGFGSFYSFIYSQLVYTMQLITDLKIPGIAVGPALIASNALLVLLLQPLFLSFQKRHDSRRLVTIGVALNLVGWAAFAALPAPVSFILFVIFFSAAEVFIFPAAMALIGENSEKDQNLRNYALFSLTRIFGSAGVLVGTHVVSATGLTGYAIFMLAGSALLLGLVLLLVKYLTPKRIDGAALINASVPLRERET